MAPTDCTPPWLPLWFLLAESLVFIRHPIRPCSDQRADPGTPAPPLPLRAGVDRVIEHEPGKRAVAIKNVTFNEPQFQGHFPGRPLMPGVLIVEAMAQVGGLIVTQMPDLPKGLFVFAGIDGVRFRRPVVPGDQLVMTCELLSLKRQRFGKVKAEATVDGQLVCSGELMFSLVD